MSLPRKSRTFITLNQRKLIHVAKRQLGMDEETYREMLRNVAGVSSSTELTLQMFQAVIDHLVSCGFKKTPGEYDYSGFVAYKEKWRKTGMRPGMATPGQLASIEAAWDHMRWYWAPDEGFGNRELALRGFLRKRFGASDLRFLNFDQAHGCIEALKAIQGRRKSGREQGSAAPGRA